MEIPHSSPDAEALSLKDGEPVSLEVFENLSTASTEKQKRLHRKMSIIEEDSTVQEKKRLRQFSYGKFSVYILEDSNGAPCSYATVFPSEKESGPTYINKIITKSTHQDKGAATLLLKNLMKRYPKIQFINIIEDPSLKTGMTGLYERMGFTTPDGLNFSWKNPSPSGESH